MNQKQQNLSKVIKLFRNKDENFELFLIKCSGNQSSSSNTQTLNTNSGSSFSSFYQQMIANNTNIIIPLSKPLRRGFADRPIKFRCFLQNTMLDVLKSRGWVEVTE